MSENTPHPDKRRTLMPKPRKNEKKDAYISRCVSYLVDKEGKPVQVAVATCHSYWEDRDRQKE